MRHLPTEKQHQESIVDYILNCQNELNTQFLQSRSALFFMTLKFEAPERNQAYKKTQDHVLLDRFEVYYTRLLKLVVSNNYQRCKHLQPRAFAFLDAPKSEYVDPTKHIHAIFVTHPQCTQRFRDAMPKMKPLFMSLNLKSEDFHVAEITRSPENVIQYASKTAFRRGHIIASSSKTRDDLFTILPKARDEPLYADIDRYRNNPFHKNYMPEVVNAKFIRTA